MDTAGHTAIADVQALEPDFEVLRELGRGTMGVVVLARRRETGRLVAIKVVHPMSGDSRDAEARVEREARTVARLQHPNIVRHYEMRRLPNGGIALVMQYVAGETLAATLRRTPRLAPEIAGQVLHDIALALKYAHEQQIVHRDVKPANIFIYPDTGAALLSDFGIAKSLEGDADITLAGFAIGTPTYMSPEQLDGHQLDRRTDIYSLGVVGWEMLSGVRPWLGENLYGVIYKQKHQALPRLASIRDDVPARIVHALDGALEKDPALRFASMAEFLEQLADDAPTNATWRRHAARGTDPTTAVTRPDAEPTVTIQFRPAVEGAAAIATTPAPATTTAPEAPPALETTAAPEATLAPESTLAPTPSAPLVPPAPSEPLPVAEAPRSVVAAADVAVTDVATPPDLAAPDVAAPEVADEPVVAATHAVALGTAIVEPEPTPAPRLEIAPPAPEPIEELPPTAAPVFVPASVPVSVPVVAAAAAPPIEPESPPAAVVAPEPVATHTAPRENFVADVPRRAAEELRPRPVLREPVAPPAAAPPPMSARAIEPASRPAPEPRDSTGIERLRGIAAARPKLPPTITKSRWSRRTAALAGAAVALLAVSVLGARAAARLEERRQLERADLAQATAAAARPTTPAAPATSPPTPTSTPAPNARVATAAAATTTPSRPAVVAAAAPDSAAPAATGSAAGHRVSSSAAANVAAANVAAANVAVPAQTPAATSAPQRPAPAAARPAEPPPAAPVSVSLASLPVVTLSAASLAELQDTVKAARAAVASPATAAATTPAGSAAASVPAAAASSAPTANGVRDVKAPAPRRPAPFDAGALALASAERLLGARDFRQARTQADAAISASPRVPDAYAVRARVRLQQGEIREAWADAEMAARLGDFWSAQAATTIVEHRAGDTTSARRRVDGLLRLTDGGKRPLAARDEIQLALALATVGDRTRAIAALDRVDPSEGSLVAALQDPAFDGLRSDSRFQALAERARRAGAAGATRRRS